MEDVAQRPLRVSAQLVHTATPHPGVTQIEIIQLNMSETEKQVAKLKRGKSSLRFIELN